MKHPTLSMSKTRCVRGIRTAVLAALVLVTPAIGQRGAGIPDDMGYSLKFSSAPLDMVLNDYSQKTGRTVLQGAKVPKAMITLRSQGALSVEEYLHAMETVLGMHGIGLVKVGEKFVKVVPIAEARQEAMDIGEQEYQDVLDDEGVALTNDSGQVIQELVALDETDELVSQLLALKYITLDEAKKAVEPLKHVYGQIHTFETINSLLVTDTAANINRITQVLQYIDQPIEAREETHVIGITYSKASEIKSKLEEIIADTRQQTKPTTPRQRASGAPGVVRPVAPPGVIRALPAAAQPAAATAEQIIEQAERGIIRGEVKIVADDRTNILIIITRPENMKFFEKIVNVLDVETAPDVVVKVFRLEFADAKEIQTILNDLIGATTPDEGPAGTSPVATGEAAKLREVPTTLAKPKAVESKSKVGELSKDNIKILADERTNALIIMASKGDLATLTEIIDDMDIMLSQVLVEAVVLEVNLDDTFESGFDWLQRSLIAYKENAAGTRTPLVGFAGSGGGGNFQPSDALSFNEPTTFPAADGNPLAGLTYYLTYFDLNMDVVMRLVSTDSRTQILSSPVILTTDNTDATINVATERYFFKGKKYVGGGDNPFYEDDVETKKVGIELTVTPRINAKKFVVMEIAQKIDNVSGVQVINNTEWPIVTTRKLEADIAVRSEETIVLGGLVLNSTTKQKTKIPILGDIPLLGWLFRSMRDEKSRSEVIVFITPYVMDSPEEIEADALRRRDAVHLDGMWKYGWSGSRFAEPSDEQIEIRKRRAKERKALRKQRERSASAEPDPITPADLEELDPDTAEFVAVENLRWDDVLDEVDREIEEEAPGN